MSLVYQLTCRAPFVKVEITGVGITFKIEGRRENERIKVTLGYRYLHWRDYVETEFELPRDASEEELRRLDKNMASICNAVQMREDDRELVNQALKALAPYARE